MAPTESTILSQFLLPPSHLPTIMSLRNFTSLFPRSLQASPEIKTLYHNLQHQRAKATDAIARNIAIEVKRGREQQRAVVRVRRQDEKEERDEEVEMESALFGQTSNLPNLKPHTLTTILPELEGAAEDVEDEISRLEEEAETLMEEMRGVVGDLSDLRYGRFANGKLRDEVLEGLARLESSANAKA